MRKIRYLVAMSVDGYIAGPNGEADWIGTDPEVHFPAIWAQFDTLLMGRRTHEAASKRLGETAFTGIASIVFSRKMKQRYRMPLATKSLPTERCRSYRWRRRRSRLMAR